LISYRRKFVSFVVVLLLTPYALTPFYNFLPPPSTLMLYDIVRLKLPQREWVPLSEMSPNLVSAVMSSEDSAFCEHWGFDFRQMEKSINKSMKNDKPLRATSTITQQTAKNLFLWHGRSWLRKILEAPLTIWMELVLPKRRILEIYLNIAQWDEGVYGAQAAAKFHYGTTARNLTPYQASLLAGALPNPIARSASTPSAFHRGLAVNIQKRLVNFAPDMSCLK